MNKIKLIIAREYLTRVKKKSFIIMTIIGPILMAALFVIPVIVVQQTQKVMKVVVVDDNDFFINKFTNTDKTKFVYRSGDVELIKSESFDEGYDAVLHILKGTQAVKTNLFFKEEPSTNFNSMIEDQIDKLLFDRVLIDSFQIDPVNYEKMKSLTKSSVSNIKIDAAGNEKESNTDLVRIVGLFSGMAIYFFIFLFASQVLRGVLEEKTNRIVEVLISSVKPIQLMMGKIVGIAMVGLTQFLIWVVLTFAIIYGVQLSAPSLFEVTPEVAEQAATLPGETQVPMVDMDSATATVQTSIFTKIDNYFNISFTALLLCFLFYFLIGYLIYAALFAAVGSAVDNEADSQQFTMPVTIPLILAMVLIVPITEDPNGSIAFWFSMIPLTSPVTMMIRLPSGVPAGQLFASMAIAVAFFILCVWFAAKIYRVGILMYGKKVTYRELFKWLKY